MTVTMPSDRMMQAIGRMEEALSGLERVAEDRASAPSPAMANRADVEAALRELDGLIAHLKDAPHG